MNRTRREFLKNSTCVLAMATLLPRLQAAEEDGVQRNLFASVHTLGDFHKKNNETFPDALERGLFVYDINAGHKLVKKFPAKSWNSWSGGWAGLAAHAGSGALFQVQDGGAVRAYDIVGEKLLWETFQAKGSGDREAATQGISYIDRRFGVTKDGKYVLLPDRDSAKKDKQGKPVGLGVPVIRVLDAATGKWVKNIPLVDPQAADKSKGEGSPHSVHVMSRYIYASQWNDGHVYCIDPQRLEVVRRLGPVVLNQENRPAGAAQSDGERRGTEVAHGNQSIQHFSVDPEERYVYVEPVRAFGIGVIEVATGKFLGHWPMPEPAPGSLAAQRYAIPAAKANQLHSKRNHGIAVRPNSHEVWMTDDPWGLLHVWDVSTLPPKYVAAVPVFENLQQPIYDFSWVNFSIDGKYAYASNKVIDADTKKVVAKLAGLNEASIEIQFQNGKVVRTGHEMGSGLDTWVAGYEPGRQP